MYKMYGIPNCNSVAKARKWFAEHDIEYYFHDYKKEGITKTKLKEWCKQLGWENLLNKAGTTWRALDEDTKASITNQDKAIQLMYEHNSIIKRPVIELDNKLMVIRFDEEKYQSIFLN